jgi:hypothetical protein
MRSGRHAVGLCVNREGTLVLAQMLNTEIQGDQTALLDIAPQKRLRILRQMPDNAIDRRFELEALSIYRFLMFKSRHDLEIVV